jgi:Ca-activated chloride channel family protein
VTFAIPLALWLIALVVPASIALHLWAARRNRARLAGVIAPRLTEQLVRSVDFRKRRLKAALFVLGLVALLVAGARPQIGFEIVEEERASIDFLIALDLSRSMLAEDVAGKTRLQAAREAIGKLLDRLGDDRAGLIGFAGEAFLAAPITQDHAALRRQLDALDTEAVARAGSDLAGAIKLAVKTFESGAFESKAVVLVTDGEELQGDAVVAAREAALKGVRVFTVGVGSAAGARVPAKRDGGARFTKNEFGREVISRLNERVMRQIAASGDGLSEPLGKDGEGLLALYRRGLEPLAKGTRKRASQNRREYFQWPLALAVMLLGAEMLIGERRRIGAAVPGAAPVRARAAVQPTL